MADFSFSDDAELQKLNAQVLNDPEDFESWDKLVRAAESQEGGLHRNSSPGAIAATRDVYDKLLARFPLFFGYWKKYADLEFSIAGTEAAEMVYERGVASIGTSVDLWANYCSFKVDTSHDNDVIRELFERGAESVGLDFLSHPFWDKYLDFEERVESHDGIFALLTRVIRIPMHQYARYFERYRGMAASRPVEELAPPEVVMAFKQEVAQSGSKQRSEREMEQELRSRIDAWHLELFNRTQSETTKRWTYESEIKRPYYHVTELDEPQLSNWRKYLDFEEGEGDYARIKFLYERCLVTSANYEEFWLRYARWMLAHPGKQEEVRYICLRACCLYVAISQPAVRLFFAQFEEAEGRPEVAASIYEAILDRMPGHVETIIALANVHRRQHGVQAAIDTLRSHIDNAEIDTQTRGALVSEWARLMWRVQGDAEKARKIFQDQEQTCLDSESFWVSWLEFEMDLPTSESEETRRSRNVKAVFTDIRTKSRLSPELVKGLATTYFGYLQECGGKDAMKEYMQLDREINGPASVAMSMAVPAGGLLAQQQSGGGAAGDNFAAAQMHAKQQAQGASLPVNGSPAVH